MERKCFLFISFILASIFLTAIGIASIGHPSKNLGVIIYAFDQNPAGLEPL
jgi:hypothetical protein